MMKSVLRLGLLPSLVAALDFQWSHDGQAYWATEIKRVPASQDKLNLTGSIGSEGLGYFKVGAVDWPQFTRTVVNVNGSSDALAPGAYVVTQMAGQVVIAKAYQVMEDPAQAFMTGVVEVANGEGGVTWKPFSGAGIPVPAAVGDGPLAGLRFAVKDLFHLNGVKTAAGSKSYYDSYPAQNHTSGIVTRNLEAGAVLTGKTKTTTFALTTTHNGWEVDYHDPINMRGDGYLTTAGSSSGSLAAVTAYDWLDFAIGSDTGGSVRGPATNGGVYGYRPSQGFYDLEGVVPCVSYLDTPGFFARSPEVFSKLFSVWSAGTELAIDASSFSIPTKMSYRTDLKRLGNEEAQGQLDAFFGKVESQFNMTSETIDLDEIWLANSGVNQSYLDYYQSVYLTMNSVDSWDLIGEPLTAAFSELTGSPGSPPVDPSVNLTWTNGQDETIRAFHDESVRRGELWRDFYSAHVLTRNNDTCSSSIIPFTYFLDTPVNRQDLVPFDVSGGNVTGGFWSTLPTSYGGAPEIVVPIGQVPYWSNFTRRTEYRPLTASFTAARGCDAVLFKLVDELAAAGILGEVSPGQLAFALE